MASDEESKKDRSQTGFAGLLSMVSDVETTVARASRQETESSHKPSIGRTTSAPKENAKEASGTNREPYQPAVRQPGRSSAGIWLLVIGPIIGLIWLVSESERNTGPSPATYSPNAQPLGSPASQAPSRPSEEKPPVGKGNVLTVAQIRYCLAEDIRLEAAKGVADPYVESDVSRFNTMVADYNSRCGEFRYRSYALESARSDIEPYRSLLQAEGRNRFSRTPSAAPQQGLASREPDVTVRAVQRRLNELGYDAGAADGLSGPKTRAAIMAFQREQNLPADGVASSSLLARLSAVTSRSGSTFDQEFRDLFGETPKYEPIDTSPSPASRQSGRDVGR